MSNEIQTTKEKSGSKFWAWLLAGLLLVLAGFFVWDKIRSDKKFKNLETEYQQKSEEFQRYKSENESMEANYSDLQKRYDALNSQYGGASNENSALRKKVADQDSVLKALKALKSEVSKALSDFKSDELKVEEKDGKIYVLLMDKLLFKSGSADIEKKGQGAIKKIAKEMVKNPDFGITVEGHTDNQPIKNSLYKDNWDLSTARANTVVRCLSDNGLPQKRLTASGRGEHSPIASNATESGRAQNRRTEIILTPNTIPVAK